MEQISQIQKINKETYPQFEKIGQNVSLSGYERFEKRKLLLLDHKKKIMTVLTSDQRKIWEEMYKAASPNEDIREIIKKDYDSRIKQWDDQYTHSKKAIENDNFLDKSLKKAQLKSLQQNYKTEKDRLKGEKDAVRDAHYW